jgi:hypothetical protein
MNSLLINDVVDAIKKISTDMQSPFFAHQAITVKVELVIRDMIHHNLIEAGHNAKKEAKGCGINNRTSCDLAIFDKNDKNFKDPRLLLELKQYYTDDAAEFSSRDKNKDYAIGVINPCVNDIEKYGSDKEVISILFLNHIDGTYAQLKEHGNQFTYYEYFKTLCKEEVFDRAKVWKESRDKIHLCFKNKDYDELLKDKKIIEEFDITLGTYKNIKVSSQVYILQKN